MTICSELRVLSLPTDFRTTTECTLLMAHTLQSVSCVSVADPKRYFTRCVIYKMYPTGTVQQIDAAHVDYCGTVLVVAYRNLYTFVSKDTDGAEVVTPSWHGVAMQQHLLNT